MTLRFAVMGTGRIAEGVLPRIAEAPGCRVVAVASRDRSRAESLASRAAALAGVPDPACTYEELENRPDVDAVYLTLPNSLHAEWCVRLLRAGKHVLCEKPLATTAREARQIADAARASRRLCTEGFMYMHHPQTERLIELARTADQPDSPIGPLHLLRSNRNVFNTDPYILSTRLSHALRGGALLDIGCYPLSIALLVAGETPDLSTLQAEGRLARWRGDQLKGCIEFKHAPQGTQRFLPVPPVPGDAPFVPLPEEAAASSGWVDEGCSFSFQFPSGLRFEGECSFTKGPPAGAGVFFEMIGARGRAFTTHPFGPDPARQPLRLETGPAAREEVIENGGDKFTNQFARFARAVRGDAPPLPSIDFSVALAQTHEAILQRVGVRW
ncbi:MAG: Gfo/Idh/MocA family oxidoreductase [Planctomycetota bacterium]|nr:Gfo/Idh/MocA family oxidoreductase [Planctomycetota bacterium]